MRLPSLWKGGGNAEALHLLRISPQRRAVCRMQSQTVLHAEVWGAICCWGAHAVLSAPGGPRSIVGQVLPGLGCARASQAERVGVGLAPSGGSVWGQHPRLMPNLPKDHANPSKVTEAKGCLSPKSRTPLPASASPWRQEGWVGDPVHWAVCACRLVPRSRISQLPHMPVWVLLLAHTVSLPCWHAVGLLFYGQLVAQPCYSPHYRPCYVFQGGATYRNKPSGSHHFPRPRIQGADSSLGDPSMQGAGGSSLDPSPFLKSQPHCFCQGAAGA